MRLLIVTQTLDRNDPILGFFVRWVEECARQFDMVHVLALNVGEYTLPDNVVVQCLGKSDGKGRLTQLMRLWRYCWRQRTQYDVVFCHMNPEYVLYGAAVWKLLRRPIGLWYTHGSVPRALRFAEPLVHSIFTASAESCRITSPKVQITGHGIDTDFFSPGTRQYREDGVLRCIAVSRIAPIKRIHVIIEFVQQLVAQQVPVQLTVVGIPRETADHAYYQELIDLVHHHDVESVVQFVGGKNQEEVRDLMQQHDVLVHASHTGSLDKVLLEAAAVGLGIVQCDAADPASIAATYTDTRPSNYHVPSAHNLSALIATIKKSYEHHFEG